MEDRKPNIPEIEEQFVRYLLGDLSHEESLAVENKYIEDDEYFEFIQALEGELVRDYVRGEMVPDLRSRFEKRFRTSGELAKKVELAQAILAESDNIRIEQRGRDPGVVNEPGVRRLLADLFRIGLPSLQWAAAVGSLAMIGLSLFLWKQNDQLRLSLAEVQRENRSLGEEKSALVRALSEKPKELLLVASFILPPGLSRNQGNTEHLIVPAGIGRVDFKLPLPAGTSYPVLRVVLERLPGGQVSSQDSTPNALIDSGKALVVGIPSVSLTPGRYVFYVKGPSNQGAYEDVQYYAFTVAK